jgi:predicted RNA-binding protein YlqC (UPF0109 family)
MLWDGLLRSDRSRSFESWPGPRGAWSMTVDDDELSDDAVVENGFDEHGGEDESADVGSYAPPGDVADRLHGLVVYLATNLVDDPQTVEVEARQRGSSVFVSLRVPEEELGKVIGRGGRIARAMRTALMITGSRSNVRASLDIED